MSHTTMYAAQEDGVLRDVATFKNSWGSAAMIWDALAKRYVPEEEFSMKAWPLVWEREEHMDPYEVEALRTTYDRVVLKREHMLRVASSLDTFAARYAQKDRVCSLREQAQTIRAQHAAGAIAIAWNQTSVTEPWHYTRSEDDEDEMNYDFNVNERNDYTAWEPVLGEVPS